VEFCSRRKQLWSAATIIDVKDVLDPSIALTILMESAIYASKLVRF
jgi:hypothetical protein